MQKITLIQFVQKLALGKWIGQLIMRCPTLYGTSVALQVCHDHFSWIAVFVQLGGGGDYFFCTRLVHSWPLLGARAFSHGHRCRRYGSIDDPFGGRTVRRHVISAIAPGVTDDFEFLPPSVGVGLRP